MVLYFAIRKRVRRSGSQCADLRFIGQALCRWQAKRHIAMHSVYGEIAYALSMVAMTIELDQTGTASRLIGGNVVKNEQRRGKYGHVGAVTVWR